MEYECAHKISPHHKLTMNKSLVFFLLLLACNLLAQQDIQSALQTFLNEQELQHATVGVFIIDAETGEELASYNPDRSLIPASSLKTISTSTALDLLGKDFRFKTELQYTGEIDAQGTLRGNVYIKGYGDPTLGSEWTEQADDMNLVLQKFTDALIKAGIKKIQGHVIGDGSFFSHSPVASSWQWEDMGNYYGAGAYGLNFRDNWYWLDFQQHPTPDSTPIVMGTRPLVPFIYTENLLTSAARGTGDNAYIYGAPFRHHVTIRGTLPVGNKTVFSIKGAIPDPVLFTAYHLTEKLKQTGVPVTELPRSVFLTKDTLRSTIYTHYSPSLSTIITEANHESINLYCEVMLKTVGLQLVNNSDYREATEAITDYWHKKGINTEGMSLRDGSGLSAKNLITARQMANILRLVSMDKEDFPVFYESLSSGKEGTLKGMFRGTRAFDNIRAKSGSMSGVRSYTGYARTKAGRLICFSVIANNFTCKSSVMRRKMERLMISLCE